MLRLSKLFLSGAAAAALLAGAPVSAQAGLGARLDAQEQQLAQAEQTCGDVNLAEYANLLQEASKNKARAEKMAKKGVPVNQTQVNADLAKAMQLFARAQAAQARHCMMQAQQQETPKTTGAVPGGTPLKGDYSNAHVGGNSPVGNPSDTPTIYQGPAGQGIGCDDYRCGKRADSQQANLSPFERAAIDAQNGIRARYGLPPLQPRADLIQGATASAQRMAADHDLSHASREGRGTARENILQAPASYSTYDMINLWVREQQDFVPGTFPNVCKSGGDCSGVYHFTQIISPITFFVGCGEASDGARTYVSCWYDKGGNKDGTEVGTPAAATVADKKFRAALLEGINRQSIVDNIGAAGSSQPARSDASAFFSTGKVDHDFKYGFAYRDAPISSESAWDHGGYVVDNIWSPTNTGVLTFLILSNSIDADGNIDTITFYDPAFADPFDSVADTNYFDTGSWRRGVRVGTNIYDILGANALFQDIGAINFGDVTQAPTDQGTANDSDQEAIDRLQADNGPLKPTTPIKDQAAAYVQQWHDEYGNFAKARDANDEPGMRDSYEKLAKITRTYFNVYWAAKDAGVDMHNAFDADDMESNLAMTWEEYKKAICKAPAAPQAQGSVDTKVEAPTLPTKEVFTPGVKPPLPDNGSGIQLYLPQDTPSDCVM